MMFRKTCCVLGLVAVVLVVANGVYAQEEQLPDSIVKITLTDGTELRGEIISETADTISLRTIGGLETQIPRAIVANIEYARGRMVGSQFYREDRNYSRLLLSPTGRPLRKGDGYFSDFYIFFPGVENSH